MFILHGISICQMLTFTNKYQIFIANNTARNILCKNQFIKYSMFGSIPVTNMNSLFY